MESDESDGSFLNLSSVYSVVTNIDKEHLNYYKNFKNLQKSFYNFVQKTASFGKSYICLDDTYARKLTKELSIKNYLTYGFDKKSNFKINLIDQNFNYSKFDLKINIFGQKIKIIKNFKLPLLGKHNIRNATAAIAVSLGIGINIKKIKNALKNFKGVQRRYNKIFHIIKQIFTMIMLTILQKLEQC